MKYYHGTSFECAELILANGFGTSKDKTVWTCSMPENTYLWPESEDEDHFTRAVENAVISAAKLGSKSGCVAVFILDIDESCDYEEYIFTDSSCENMEEACEVDCEWLNQMIIEGKIKLDVAFSEGAYLPEFRWFYLSNANTNYMDFTEEELQLLEMAKLISSGDYFDLYEITSYTQVTSTDPGFVHSWEAAA